MIKNKENKKGQSETVGFVLIVIIVTIMILVFLYFILRTPSNTLATSADMTNLLNAFSVYTTNCSTTFIPEYKTGQELIKDCFGGQDDQCLDGKTVCETLNETFKKVIGGTLNIGEDSPIKAYKITVNYYVKGVDNQNQTKYSLQEGSFTNCTERNGGYSQVSQSPGMLEVRLQVCKGRK
jgi:hypothetical protein